MMMVVDLVLVFIRCGFSLHGDTIRDILLNSYGFSIILQTMSNTQYHINVFGLLMIKRDYMRNNHFIYSLSRRMCAVVYYNIPLRRITDIEHVSILDLGAAFDR